MSDIINFQLLTAFAAILSGVLGILLSLVARRKIKPMEADSKKHQEELKERRKGLEPFLALQIPLYYNDELLDTIYTQIQLNQSPMEVNEITRKISSESGQKLDGKILSVEGKQIESEEQTLKEIKNREMKYKRTLEWMCDTRQVVMGLEEPAVSSEKARQLEEQLRNSFGDMALMIPANEMKNMQAMIMRETIGWLEQDKLEKGVAPNKFLLVKGNFLVKERLLEQIHLVLKNNIKFHVYCNVENCTTTGKGTFIQGSSVPVGVFGYIKEMSKKEPMVAINPVSISSMSLDSEKGKNAQGV